MTQLAIDAAGLRKVYGRKKEQLAALDGFDLRAAPGTVCGLLGPNGAGKTTAVRVLTTLARLDEGYASVAGHDVASAPDEVRKSIGLVGQNAAVDEVLNARQNLVMFGRLFHLDARAAARRADELLEQFDLTDTGDRSVKKFSGGMRRRLDLAASLVLRPDVLFLDEPTTGLDPRGRNEVWAAVRMLVERGTTVLLTTQYLDEADQLADRIAVMQAGRVIVEGTATELKATAGGDHLEVVVRDQAALDDARTVVAEAIGVDASVRAETSTVSAPVADRVRALEAALGRLDASGIAIDDIGVRRPTLDDVFLTVTGHRVPAAEAGSDDEEVAA
ncbi:ATP-binding cassette domain-containing protein [Solicola gregarius]|uniref:ATP-binding cassette domain-containing protein n=1 Tax=Solicola gregarius TaxID=2908642 RepID=A0AA46TKJ7_9ACTN|nr:ATP-binding cassette domain-containing protein [Solicola gregarius]UYM06800.1 ATP-binding cassette domain-containing protein [Solicola gregarius]